MFGSFNVLIAMRHFLILTVKKKQSRLGTHAHRKRVNRLTDEIKKAMGCNSPFECLECDLVVCRAKHLPEPIVDLIKRQKAEIERLQNAYKQCAWERDAFLEEIKTAKAKVVTEFAEKLKEYYPSISDGIDYTAGEVLKG